MLYTYVFFFHLIVFIKGLSPNVQKASPHTLSKKPEHKGTKRNGRWAQPTKPPRVSQERKDAHVSPDHNVVTHACFTTTASVISRFNTGDQIDGAPEPPTHTGVTPGTPSSVIFSDLTHHQTKQSTRHRNPPGPQSQPPKIYLKQLYWR